MASIYSTSILTSGIPVQDNRTTREEGYSPVGGAYLLTQTTKPGNVVNDFKNLPVFSFKNHSNDYLALRKAAESFLINSYSEYIFLARNIVVRLSRTVIIFPFHYFW